MEDRAHLDVAMYGFLGGRCEKSYVDVEVFNPDAPITAPRSIYCHHELNMKKHAYET